MRGAGEGKGGAIERRLSFYGKPGKDFFKRHSVRIKKGRPKIACLEKFNLKTTKPVSRILFFPFWGKRLSFIWDAAHTPPHAANPRTSGEPPSGVRLFGISARKVYPYPLLPMDTVVSYTTFSPLPVHAIGRSRRLFSVALSVPLQVFPVGDLPVR